MSQIEILNQAAHADIKVNSPQAIDFKGFEPLSMIPVMPSEMRHIIGDYPVFFVKNGETGDMLMAALLGFEKNENLFMEAGIWGKKYLPMHIQRGPFKVNFPEPEAGENTADAQEKQMLIGIELDSPLVGKEEGELLFKESGEPSDYLSRVQTLLTNLIVGEKQAELFVKKLVELDLLEPVTLNVEFGPNQVTNITNLYGISEEKVSKLEGELLQELYSGKVIELIHLALASISRLPSLIALKRDKLGAA